MPFNEAPASANVRIMSANGFEWQFTMRAESGKDLMQKMAAFEAKALAEGYQPLGRQSAAARSPQQPPAGNANGSEAGSFTVEELYYDGKSKQGDDSWRVKGGTFTKFGMLMYPEQWQASNLQIPAAGQPINAAGWTAHHNGKKIIRLEPPPRPEAERLPAPVANGNGNGNANGYHNEFDF